MLENQFPKYLARKADSKMTLMKNFKKWMKKNQKIGKKSQMGRGKKSTNKKKKKKALESMYNELNQQNSYEPNTRMSTYLLQNGV